MAAKYLGFGKGDQTAVRKKKFTEGTLRHSLYKQTQESITNGEDPREMVKIKEGTPLEDWFAVHVVDFFNRIQMLYLLIYDACTEQSCPKMSGGARVEYLWQDGIKYKKPEQLHAREYIQCLFDWVEMQVFDENIFPKDPDVEFPKNFKKTCVKILTRMFRVFVHVYIHHFDRILELKNLKAEAHGNTLFRHFYFFVKEFQLIEDKELEPLKDLIEKICK